MFPELGFQGPCDPRRGCQDRDMSPAHPDLCPLTFAGLQTTPELSGLKQLFV